jgi:hypothetical protein
MDETFDAEIQALVADAREAWAAIARCPVRIDYIVRMEASGVRDSITLEAYLDRLIRDLKRTSGGIWLYAAIHTNPFLHAHGVIHLSRRLAGRFINTQEFQDWLRRYWYHGPVWAAPFDATQQHARGAAGYAARDPGTVVWG